jgi:DNA-binding response OmpR family regulator
VLPNVEEIATVVVCEDDDPTRELLCDQLTADRYRALPAPSASDALRLCGYNHPDLMLLDLGLPDAPGIDVLREIRSSGERFDPELPVLVLSGRSTQADRLRGFEAGADDFLEKPFHYPELLARLSAVLRRRNGARRGPIRIGDLAVDPVTRQVRVGERRVELANKEFAHNPHSNAVCDRSANETLTGEVPRQALPPLLALGPILCRQRRGSSTPSSQPSH